MLWPCLCTVSSQERMTQKCSAPSSVRKQPEIFCLTLGIYAPSTPNSRAHMAARAWCENCGCGASQRARSALTQAINQLRAILVSAPQDIRERIWKPKAENCVEACSHLRNLGPTVLLQTLTTTLRLLAKRWLTLAAELKELDASLETLTNVSAPHLRAQFGIGPQTAAVLIAAAGNNPERLRS